MMTVIKMIFITELSIHLSACRPLRIVFFLTLKRINPDPKCSASVISEYGFIVAVMCLCKDPQQKNMSGSHSSCGIESKNTINQTQRKYRQIKK